MKRSRVAKNIGEHRVENPTDYQNFETKLADSSNCRGIVSGPAFAVISELTRGQCEMCGSGGSMVATMSSESRSLQDIHGVTSAIL